MGAPRTGPAIRQIGRTAGASHLLVQDTEILGSPAAGQFYTVPFCPGAISDAGSTPTLSASRLNAEAAKYNKFRLRYVNIAFKSTAATVQTGTIAVGIMAGKEDKSIKDETTILKTRPFFVGPAWKSQSLSVGANVQSQLMFKTSTKGDDDAVPFTIYINNGADKTVGYIEVSYLVELHFPKP